MDLLIKSSAFIELSSSSQSKACIHRSKEPDQIEEASYLVIGRGEMPNEVDYVNYPSNDNTISKSRIISTRTDELSYCSPSMSSQIRMDKPETSSSSTMFTVAPSVSSSSSSALSSVAPRSPVSVDCMLTSPGYLHDSTISRLIDAVSLDNEQDTCGSISALIDQFDTTADQNDFALSHDRTPPHHSNFRLTTGKVLHDLRSPLKSPIQMDYPISPQKEAQRTNHVLAPCKTSHTNPPLQTHFSSPETAELEEVYTILDEEVLSPVSVYNLKKPVSVQADGVESTPSNTLGSSPAKPNQGLGKGHHFGSVDLQIKESGSVEVEQEEESVYEEVYDPPVITLKREQHPPTTNMGLSVNCKCYQDFYDSAEHGFAEVEVNVDEDPLERILVSPRHGSLWKGLASPTKRHAIYQNADTPTSYFQQKKPASFCNHQQQLLSHKSHVSFPQQSSPMNQALYKLPSDHQHQTNSQPSPFQRPIDSRSYESSSLHPKSYPVSRSYHDQGSDNRDFNRSYTQQRNCCGSQMLNKSNQDRIGYKEIRESVRCFQNGSSASENLPGHSTVSINTCRDKALSSPFSDVDAMYSHVNYGRITPTSEASALHNPHPHRRSQTQSCTPRQPWSQPVSHYNNRLQSQPENRYSLKMTLGPSSTCSPSTPKDTTPGQCKSKSLGDLTSEDISCNFQSKYNIISRSFITPEMRKQWMMGATGTVTLQSQACDPLTAQLRKLVSLEGDDNDPDRPQSPQLHQEAKSSVSQQDKSNSVPCAPESIEGSPPLLTRRLSSRSQSRVRHINSRARERQQEALKPRAGVLISNTASIGGVVLRNKPASQNPPANRHSTGSYIAGYLGRVEDRGLPEGACTSLHYGNGDHYGDHYYTDDFLPPPNSSHSVSEPEVYFLLRL